ncbi:MAG TPA: hypothetical protein VEH04_11440 [Verrucomicrobiae bacterium]|nr:hypothetical protein [Verrucomicrobiae bacterium]
MNHKQNAPAARPGLRTIGTLMKTYTSVLPAATRKRCRDEQALREVKARLHEIFTNGFWYCRAHEGTCERIESDQGQPATCDRCGSAYIEWNPPIWTGLIDDGKVIQPADFNDGKEAA